MDRIEFCEKKTLHTIAEKYSYLDLMFIQTTTSCKNSWNYLILGDPTEEVQGVRITDECLFHWSFSNNRMTAGLITIRPATYITI